MLFRRRAERSADAAPGVPAGERVYAVGDVHGRLDLLTRLVARIDEHDRARPPAATTLIFIGDLVDRGPDSAGVLRLVRALRDAGRFRVRLIKGNHEEILLSAAQGSARATRALVEIGGDATIRSFGITDEEAESGGFADLANLLRARIPAEDVALLDQSEDLIEIGDYAFVHAGIRPGVALADQNVKDLRWIRREFLNSTRRHGKIIVHGHTVTPDIEERPNRLGLDTGAFASGRLSAVGLEGDRRWFLAATDEEEDVRPYPPESATDQPSAASRPS